MDRDVVDGDRLSIAALLKRELSVHPDRILYVITKTVTYKRLHIVMTDKPYRLASRISTFQDGSFHGKIVLRDWHQAVVPGHLKVKRLTCYWHYSRKMKSTHLKSALPSGYQLLYLHSR